MFLPGAVAWLFTIGRDLKISAKYAGQPLAPGQLLHYATPGRNNDHFEWLLSTPVNGSARHAGGGRARNAITEGGGTILWSSGRPLRYVFDVPQVVT